MTVIFVHGVIVEWDIERRLNLNLTDLDAKLIRAIVLILYDDSSKIEGHGKYVMAGIKGS